MIQNILTYVVLIAVAFVILYRVYLIFLGSRKRSTGCGCACNGCKTSSCPVKEQGICQTNN